MIEDIDGGRRLLAEIADQDRGTLATFATRVAMQLSTQEKFVEPFFAALQRKRSGAPDLVAVRIAWQPNKPVFQLVQFLSTAFEYDPLHRFISQSEDGPELLTAMQLSGGSKRDFLAYRYVSVLKQRNALDAAFFRRLCRQRPEKTERIEKIALVWGVRLREQMAHQPVSEPEPEPEREPDGVLLKLLLKELTLIGADAREALARALGVEVRPRERMTAERLVDTLSGCDLLVAVKAINSVDFERGGLKGVMSVVLPFCFRPEDGRPLPEQPDIYEVAVATTMMLEVARARSDRRACEFELGGDQDLPQIRSKFEMGPLPDMGPDPDGTRSVDAIEVALASRFRVDSNHRMWRIRLRERLAWFVDPSNHERRSAFYVVEAPSEACGWLVAVPQLREHYPALHFLKLSTDDIERFKYETRVEGPLGSLLARNSKS